MADVKVPTLGESITEATLGEWLKNPGDPVQLDEPIASLETDKVSVEVGSPVAGVMGEQLVVVDVAAHLDVEVQGERLATERPLERLGDSLRPGMVGRDAAADQAPGGRQPVEHLHLDIRALE